MKSKSTKKADTRLQIMGVGVGSTDLSGVLTKIDEFVQNSLKSGPRLVVTVNPEFVMLAQKDDQFKKVLNNADLAVPDGVGLRLAEKTLSITPGRKIVEAMAKNKRYKIFYLGGRDGVAQKMAKKYGGYFHPGHNNIKKVNDQENQEIIKAINDIKPDVLLVAYGAPYQEKWLSAMRSKLSAKVAMGVGGSFDYLVGHAALPPALLEKLGLEWFWRLIREPWRAKRQMMLVKFAWRALTHL